MKQPSQGTRKTWMERTLEDLQRKRERIHQGGGPQAIARHKKAGKLTARERIRLLLDPDKPSWEIGTFAGWELYPEYGGTIPAAGTVVVIGYVSGKMAIVVANDATVKAGAWFPITVKKNLRAQEIALQNRIPIIYLVDSAGVFLPLQDEVFPDRFHFGRVFYYNSLLSARGIPQIAAIMGSCVAGGAYLPILSDDILIVEGTGSVFLAGPYLVKAAIGEETDIETLGGARTHTEISGVADYRCSNDEECLRMIRQLMEKVNTGPRNVFDRVEPRPPRYPPEKIYEIVPEDITRPYDMREVLQCILDDSDFVEYKKNYGKTLICGYGRIDGWAVGIVANQRKIVKSGRGELQIGGVIYSDSADKAARFIMACNQKRIPIVFFQDVTGFMVGTRAEHGGIIKDGAKMVNVVSNTVVPKFTIVVGNSFGAGNYAMCGRAYEPRLMLAWPSARIAVMGGQQAARTLLQIRKRQYEKEGKPLSPEEEQRLLREIEEQYETQMRPLYAAARLWVDEIIDPAQTRSWISMGIAMADHNDEMAPFVTGVLQT